MVRQYKLRSISVGSKPRNRDHGRPESGAALVEFAIIAAIFFGLILGVIDFSFAMYDVNASNFGVRSTTRLAATSEVGTDSSCPLVGLVADPGDDTSLRRLICGTKTRARLDSTRIRVKVRFESASDPLVAGASVPGDSLVLCTMTRARSLSGVFGPVLNDRVIKARARTRLETAVESIPVIVPGSETAFPGEDWSFCNPTVMPAGWSQITTTTSTTTTSTSTTTTSTTTSTTTTTLAPAYCRVVWNTGAGTWANGYNLQSTMQNLSGTTWTGYNVTFSVPASHTIGGNYGGWGTGSQVGQTVTFAKAAGNYGGTLAGGATTTDGVGLSINAPTGFSMSPWPATNVRVNGNLCT